MFMWDKIKRWLLGKNPAVVTLVTTKKPPQTVYAIESPFGNLDGKTIAFSSYGAWSKFLMADILTSTFTSYDERKKYWKNEGYHAVEYALIRKAVVE